jgi:hypothetical protein
MATNTYITSSYSTLYRLLKPGYRSIINKDIVLAIFTIIV